MDLEGESVLYKKSSDLFLLPNNTSFSLEIESFNFNILEKKKNIKAKDPLKAKNDEIFQLKNELVKKEQQLLLLQKRKKSPIKEIEKEIYIQQIESKLPNNKQVKVLNKPLFPNRSDLDFFKCCHNKYKRKYVYLVDKQIKPNKIPSKNINYENLISERSILDASLRKSFDQDNLNITMTNDGEDLNKNYIEKNIYSELRNMMEEKRIFLLQTMTYENFSFDILSDKKNKINVDKKEIKITSKKDNSNVSGNSGNFSTNSNNYSNDNLNSTASASLIQAIDSMIEKIQQRKKFVENEKKSLQKLKQHYA